MVTLLVMLGLLVLPYVVLWPVPGLRERASLRGCLGLALVFGFTGMGHFLLPDRLAEMIPPAVPYRLELVYASGVVEILAGLALLPPATRAAAGWFAIALLAALLPLNVYAAVRHAPVGGHEWGPPYLLVRVPVQGVLAAWCYWFAVRMPRGATGRGTRPRPAPADGTWACCRRGVALGMLTRRADRPWPRHAGDERRESMPPAAMPPPPQSLCTLRDVSAARLTSAEWTPATAARG